MRLQSSGKALNFTLNLKILGLIFLIIIASSRILESLFLTAGDNVLIYSEILFCLVSFASPGADKVIKQYYEQHRYAVIGIAFLMLWAVAKWMDSGFAGGTLLAFLLLTPVFAFACYVYGLLYPEYFRRFLWVFLFLVCLQLLVYFLLIGAFSSSPLMFDQKEILSFIERLTGKMYIPGENFNFFLTVPYFDQLRYANHVIFFTIGITMYLLVSAHGMKQVVLLGILAGLAIFQYWSGGRAAIGLSILLLLLFSITPNKKPLLTLKVWSVLIVAAGLYFLIIENGIRDIVAASTSNFTTGRIHIWHCGVQAISQKPLWGWGLGSLNGIEPMAPCLYTGMHNAFLQYSLRLGLPFSILVFLILFSVWWPEFRKNMVYWKQSDFAGLVGFYLVSLYFVYAQVSCVFTMHLSLMTLALVAGLIGMSKKQERFN